VTRLLASVSNDREADMALTGGADIIDLKEPANGALGAVAPSIQLEVVQRVAGRCPVSATIGDLPMMADTLSRAIAGTANTGVDIVKVGLPHLQLHRDCLQALSDNTSRGIRVVAVLFAEHRPPLRLLDELAQCGCLGVMLDTADKSSGHLRSLIDQASLAAFVRHARSLGLLSGLAGSLTIADIEPLMQLNPDYLGFRGALCESGARTERLSISALARVREAFDTALSKCTRSVA